MVAYWAVNRQGLQEATAADVDTDTASNGRAANGNGCGRGGGERGEENGRLGASGKEEEEGREGSVSHQERVFLSIVARYLSQNRSSVPGTVPRSVPLVLFTQHFTDPYIITYLFFLLFAPGVFGDSFSLVLSFPCPATHCTAATPTYP